MNVFKVSKYIRLVRKWLYFRLNTCLFGAPEVLLSGLCRLVLMYYMYLQMTNALAISYITLRFDKIKSYTILLRPLSWQGTLVNTLQEVRPTLFIAVPRVVEKFEERMKDKTSQVTGIKKKIGAWARRSGLEGVYAQING